MLSRALAVGVVWVSFVGGVWAAGGVNSPGQLGEKVFSPGQLGEEVFSPGQLGEKVSSPGQLGEEAFTPGQVGEEAFTPGQVGEEALTPGQVGEEALSPGQLKEEVFSPGQLKEEVFTPGQLKEKVSSPGQVGEEALSPGQVGEEVFTPGQLGEEVFSPRAALNEGLLELGRTSTVFALNFSNLFIVLGIKLIALFLLGGLGFGFVGRSTDGGDSSWLDGGDMLFTLAYLVGDATERYDCLNRLACLEYRKAQELLTAASMMAKGAKVLRPIFGYSLEKYDKVTWGVEDAMLYGREGGPCRSRYFCSAMPSL